MNAQQLEQQRILAQQQMQQQAAAQQAQIEGLLMQAGVSIYAQLIAKEPGHIEFERKRQIANQARDCAPFILEAYGLVKLENRSIQMGR